MDQSEKIADIRKEYTKASLDVAEVARKPMLQFQGWMEEAIQSQVPEPNAMTLATVSGEGRPSARVVLIKGWDELGIKFYSNYQSHKGKDMEANPWVCVNFFWAELERQIRIEGKVEKLSEAESTEYFHSRPKESQMGAWASPQSQVIASRKILEENFQKIRQEYESMEEIPKPPHWGGYRVIVEQMEFWQGRPSRLHDRILYTQEGKDWKIERLAP